MVIGGLWPVVQRELRESARLPINHWIRVSGAVLGTVIIWLVSRDIDFSVVGVAIFTKLDVLLTSLILFLLPTLTADSIAKERREGTLGLLLMTPLRPDEIVIGKVVSRILQVLLIWLGMVPLLAVSFFCGGIEPRDILTICLIHSACGMIALAAGLLATSYAKNRMAAYVLAFVLLGIFIQPFKSLLTSFAGSNAPVALSGAVLSGMLNGNGNLSSMYFAFSNSRGSAFAPMPAATVGYSSFHPPIDALLFRNLLAIILLWISIRIAGHAVRRHGNDAPPSKRQIALAKRYCTPVLKGLFRRRMQSAKESNPIAWLQQYSWKARASKWGLCLLFTAIATFALGDRGIYQYAPTLFWCLLLLVAAYTFAGVNGFHYDKASGALELILVTPLSVGKIILGRARGLWLQFLPSLLVLLGCNLMIQATMNSLNTFNYYSGWQGHEIDLASFVVDHFWFINLEIIAIYLTLPIIATCFALSARKILWASVTTASLAFAPMLIILARDWLIKVGLADAEPFSFTGGLVRPLLYLVLSPFVQLLLQYVVTVKIYRRLVRALERRQFAF